MRLNPAHAPFNKFVSTRPVDVEAFYCTPLTLVDLGVEYVKLGTFIRDEAMKVGKENDESIEVCTDISARNDE